MSGGGGTVLRHALFTPHLFPSYFTPQVRWLPHSPQSLTTVSSWGFAALPPSCDANYFGKILILFIMNLPDPTSPIYPRFLQ
ncbi:hypothetical protein D9T94_11475 [Salmonella enterica]|nr:hypothetical protein [Salmonella enterica]EBZ2886672.1 hypothetical protein [Salmonella enterica subsp. enterica serovar Blockley]EAB2562808.1 hypothetical protein [Salmonella enterica]EAB2876214.1 hypothetical protein [Salmonella enterica]EAB3841361.1 hypothetical protein [Salmonella enterica]